VLGLAPVATPQYYRGFLLCFFDQRGSCAAHQPPIRYRSVTAWIPVMAIGLIGGTVIVGAVCIYIAVKY
jgi:hypothetical protein